MMRDPVEAEAAAIFEVAAAAAAADRTGGRARLAVPGADILIGGVAVTSRSHALKSSAAARVSLASGTVVIAIYFARASGGSTAIKRCSTARSKSGNFPSLPLCKSEIANAKVTPGHSNLGMQIEPLIAPA
jgi:hypothetical protein